MANNRIYYAVEACGIAPQSTTSFVALRGVQSVGMNTTFNLDNLFEMGMVSIYAQIENLPDIEVNLEKVLDGYPLIYHHATRGATEGSLSGRSDMKCNFALNIYTDTQQAASGTPVSQCVVSGAFVNSVSYRIQVDGPATETVSLVANNKQWLGSGFTFLPAFTPTGVPFATEGVDFRQHVDMGSSRFPTSIPGISTSGTNDSTNGVFGAHLQSANASVNLGRENLLELGSRSPYFRFVRFPVEVTCEIQVTSSKGDFINATELGTDGLGNNLKFERIYIVMKEGTKIDLGTKNKLTSVNHQGGDASQQGGNVVNTYNYINYNDFLIVHPQDPTVALAG